MCRRRRAWLEHLGIEGGSMVTLAHVVVATE